MCAYFPKRMLVACGRSFKVLTCTDPEGLWRVCVCVCGGGGTDPLPQNITSGYKLFKRILVGNPSRLKKL